MGSNPAEGHNLIPLDSVSFPSSQCIKVNTNKHAYISLEQTKVASVCVSRIIQAAHKWNGIVVPMGHYGLILYVSHAETVRYRPTGSNHSQYSMQKSQPPEYLT